MTSAALAIEFAEGHGEYLDRKLDRVLGRIVFRASWRVFSPGSAIVQPRRPLRSNEDTTHRM